MCVYVYIYIYTYIEREICTLGIYMYTYVYIYIYTETERERESFPRAETVFVCLFFQLCFPAQLLRKFCGELGRLPVVLVKRPTNTVEIAETTNPRRSHAKAQGRSVV